MAKQVDLEISKIIQIWEKEGLNIRNKFPQHPELVYRNSGDWRGWSKYLGCPETDDIRMQDELENRAYKLLAEKGN